MSMSFGLGAQLNQSQKLTPQMQQAIRLLQLSSLELEQEVQEKLDSNPLLERIEDGTPEEQSASPDDWKTDDFYADNSPRDSQDDGDFEYDELSTADELGDFMDDGSDSIWQEVYDDDVMTYGMPEGEGNFESGTTGSIQDHVRWQMNFKHLSDLDTLIAEHLIDSMDERGFVQADLAEIVASFTAILSFYELDDTVGIEEVQAVLRMIQSCNPAGVGARDLAECLLLQLKALPKDTCLLKEAYCVLSHSHHLQNNNIKALIDETGLDIAQIKEAINLIRTLNPNPADAYAIDSAKQNSALADNTISQEIPDILVLVKNHNKKTTANTMQTDSWQIMLNPVTLPKLGINQEYASLIKRGDDSSTGQYLKKNLSDARLFIRSIEERNQNLLKVATCIVQKQQGFMIEGVTAMQPLVLREVADEIGVHESTVSRLTTNKSILTPQGLYPLKYFFSSHVQGADGEISSTAISAKIRELIDGENPKKPLSDNKIVKILAEEGIEIARRTIAKYREAMGIAASSQRKMKL